MSNLNAMQQKAVESTEGPLLILAGPGTGKTKTLIARTRHIIEEGLALPEEITVTTFTRKASFALISRLEIPCGSLHVGNFHVLAGEILERFSSYLPYRGPFRLMDSEEQIYFLLKKWPNLTDIRKARTLATLLNNLREGFVDVDASEEAKVLLRNYLYLLYENQVIDFSGMLFETLRLLEHEEVLSEVQKGTKYLMVDEYQDTNPIQEKILQKFAQKTGNICVVGDDDQSLYRFRGARVYNLLSFAKRYKGAKIIVLTENYRSKPSILAVADQYIRGKHPEHRLEKNLKAHRTEDEKAVYTVLGKDLEEQAARLSQAILHIRRCQGGFGDMVLIAFSVQSQGMQLLLRKLRDAGIPVSTTRQSRLMHRREVQAYADRILGALREEFLKEEDTIRFLLRFLSEEPFSSMLEKALKENERMQAQNLSLFLSRLRSFILQERIYTLEGKRDALIRLLEEGAIPFLRDVRAEGACVISNENYDALTVMTIHQSKGLEFPCVILAEPLRKKPFHGTNILKRFPRSADLGPEIGEAAEEELDTMRLYYTAFTRAKDLLLLTGVDVNLSKDFYGEGQKKRPQLHEDFLVLNGTLPAFKQQEISISKAKAEKEIAVYAYTTDIALYQQCPRKFFFTRILELPEPFSYATDYGNLVHAAIAQRHADRTLSVSDLGRAFQKMGAQISDMDIVRADEEVTAYWENFGKKLEKEVITENLLRVSHAEYILQGKPDLVVPCENLFVDFKTGKGGVSDTYREQLIFYRMLSGKGGGRNILYFTGNGLGAVDVSVTEEDIDAMKVKVEQVLMDIGAHRFDGKAKDPLQCKRCSMHSFCYR